eukprot:1373806-Alexandrium_andersonii.AAC.1
MTLWVSLSGDGGLAFLAPDMCRACVFGRCLGRLEPFRTVGQRHLAQEFALELLSGPLPEGCATRKCNMRGPRLVGERL